MNPHRKLRRGFTQRRPTCAAPALNLRGMRLSGRHARCPRGSRHVPCHFSGGNQRRSVWPPPKSNGAGVVPAPPLEQSDLACSPTAPFVERLDPFLHPQSCFSCRGVPRCSANACHGARSRWARCCAGGAPPRHSSAGDPRQAFHDNGRRGTRTGFRPPPDFGRRLATRSSLQIDAEPCTPTGRSPHRHSTEGMMTRTYLAAASHPSIQQGEVAPPLS